MKHLCSFLCLLLAGAPVVVSADQKPSQYTEEGISAGTNDALQSLSNNAIVATNQPSAEDQSIQGLSVGSQVNSQAITNAPTVGTNVPAENDQSVSGLSVAPSLATNPSAAPSGLNAGTNSLTNLPSTPSPAGLPEAPMITNPITPSSLPAALPDTTTGPLPMATPTATNFGLIDQTMKLIHDVPLSAEALAKAGNKIVPNVVAKNAKRMNIDEVVQYALAHNPDVLTAVQNIQRASGNFINVRAGLLPKLNVAPGYTWLDPQIQQGQTPPGYGSGGIPSVQVNQAWNINFQGTQLLYDGWKTPALTDAAKLSEQIAYFQLRQTLDKVVADVVRQFYQVVLNRALVIANEQQVALYKTQVSDQQSRYDAGTVPRFNVLQAQVQLANAMPPLINAENNLRVSMFTLIQLIGMDYPNLQNMKLPIDVTGELGYYPRKIDDNASIHTALQRNPSLKAQRFNILVTAKQVTASISGWLPTINANGGYQIQSYKYDQTLSESIQGWFFGATGSWAVWDSLATYGNVKQAKATMQNAKISYDNAVRSVVTQVQTAISNLRQAKETIESQRSTVEQATEALRLSRERLDAGAGVQLDVINAQVQLLQAQTSVLQALFNYISATAEYDRALSLHTQYEELFDDPLNKWEKERYRKYNAQDRPRPQLPKSMRKEDPLPPSVQFDNLIKSSSFRKEQPAAKKQKSD